MDESFENPYQSPLSVPETLTSAECEFRTDWKFVLKRWEHLRIFFNLFVGLSGLPAFTNLNDAPIVIFVAIVYGVAANVMFLLGPATDLYFHWFADIWEGMIFPRWFCKFVRSGGLRMLLFVLGTLFSILLTLALATEFH
jgi:hypothetical protein